MAAATQVPPLQLVEQQSYPPEQASPSVRQVKLEEPGGTAWQVPEVVRPQLPVPEQQSDGLPQAVPIWRQLLARHCPAMQLRVQQSLALLQASPAALQNWLVVQTGWPPTVSGAQVPEQHAVWPGVQAVLSATQVVEPWVHLPPVHCPRQQGVPPTVQAAWSVMHWTPGTAQVPATQSNPLQHGLEASQAPPAGLHDPVWTQVPEEQVEP